MAGARDNILFGNGLDLSGNAAVANKLDTDGFIYFGSGSTNPVAALPTSVNDTVTFHPSAGGLGFEDRRWLTAFVVDPSADVGVRGTYQTLAAANTAASSGDTIFIRPGTYTEDWTAKPGVNYTAFPGDGAGQVTIVGKLSASGVGTSNISNIELETNGDFVVEVTGANATVLNFYNCTLTLSDNTGISDTGSGSSSFRFVSCTINANTTGITYFASTNGNTFFTNCIMNNLGGSTTTSTFSGTGLFIRWCFLGLPITVSGTAKLEALACQWDTTNATAVNMNSTATGNILNYCYLNTGTATPLAIGTGATLITPTVNLRHSNATAVSGLGTLVYGTINQSSTVGAISPSATTTKATNLGELKLNLGATINEISTDGTLAGNSDVAVPTEQAVKTYVDTNAGGGAWELISSATASASATIDFTGLSSTYFMYMVVINNLRPSTDADTFWMRTSTNNGTSYDSGASDYGWSTLQKSFDLTGSSGSGSAADTKIQLTTGNGNAANEIASYIVYIQNPSAATYTQILAECVSTGPTAIRFRTTTGGIRLSAADVDAIRFLMSTGNIATGEFKLYGLKAA